MSTKEERQKIKLGRTGSQGCYGKSADTEKLIEAVKRIETDLPPPSINDLIMRFNGDKFELARKLSEGGTKKDYDNQLRNINRYLKKQRSPSTKTKQRFKELYLPPPRHNLKVKIKGCVNVSSEYYYKDNTWNKPIIVPSYDVIAFINLTKDNIEDGYKYLNGKYMQSGLSDDTIIWLNNVEIDMSF